jgi:hypothetical protein
MTALDQNFSDLANILMQRRQMQAQQIQQDRANRLSDLQFKQLQREDDYQTGLRDVMSNPGGSGVTLPQLQPQPQQNTLASLAPGNRLPFPQPQASFAPVEAKLSPSRAGAEYALGQGRAKDAVELFSVDDHVAQLRAKGDLQGYYEAQRELEEGSKFFDVVNKFKANPKQLTALWPQIQRMFPQQSEGITPDSIKFNSDYTVLPLVMDGKTITGKGILRDSEGKTSIIDTTPKSDPEAMIDKRFANQQRLTQMQIDAADRRAAAERASAERRAAGKADPADAIVAREAVKDLPKLRREARTAEASKPRIAQMVSLIDRGAGGLKGNALAAVSGVFDTPATSEAELFKKLASAGAGQLRTAVIGPGAVSNYEQSLLQSISGGGNGARTAIRQLLKFYEQEADRTISNYNDAVDSAATVAPKVTKGFGKVGGSKGNSGKKDPLGIL